MWNARKFSKLSLIFMILSGIMMSLAAQDLRTDLFKEADKALKETKANRGDLLSPANFEKAMEYYRNAERDFEKGNNIEDIRKKLRAAVAYFDKANKTVKLAEVTFVNVLSARDDALKAKAPEFSSGTWKEAEEKFNEAARELEKGDVNDAKDAGSKAETLYRKAELEAIKTHYLEETRRLLKKADEMDVEDQAPQTLKTARELVEKAEKELKENRYDKDVPRSLAQQAKYEAKHAIYLSDTIKKLKDNDMKFEDLLLLSEEPLRKIAAQIDLVAKFDEGYGKVTNQIIDYIGSMQDSTAEMSQQLNRLNQELTAIKQQISGMSEEKTKLQQTLAARQRINEKFDQIEKTFAKNEARVLLTTDNKVIIRLEGLNFAVGKSVIEPKFFGLLTKVQNAINTFPGAKISIEGHTDSQGSDQLNQKLSQERADAVKSYLLANMSIDPSLMEAIGYGESKPIANNETAEGRAKNRRIDIVIDPQISGLE